MRLTDADALKQTFCAECDHSIKCEDCDIDYHFGHLAPTVDAVEVVRCRDCKWWDEDDNDLYGYCMAMKHGYMSANWEIGIYRKYKGDFYCADGERREDAD